MIIRNKFNGYGFDGSRLCHDPVSLSIAATQAGAASSAAAAALAAKTAAATTAATTAATAAAGKTAALELAKKEAISAGMKQAGTEAAKQGIAQAGQQVGVEAAKQTGVEAAKQGIFSANPAGMPPTAGAPVTPAGPATTLPPAGPSAGTPFTPPTTPPPTGAEMTLEQQIAAAKENAARELAARGGNVKGTAAMRDAATQPFDPTATSSASPGHTPFTQGTTISSSPAIPPTQSNALLDGVQMGLDLVKKHPMETGLLTMGVGQYMNKPEEEDKDKYKNTVDMSEFKPSVPTQRPFTRSYEYQQYAAEGGLMGYAVGGPVERMAAQNAVGANTGYPMANLQTPMYTNPMIQNPEATNVVAPSADAGVSSYSGEARFASGGLSAAERREYGLRTRGQRAAQGLTKSYEEMEADRQREAMKLFNESSLPTPRPIARSRTQELSSPFSAAMAEHARLGKKAKVPVVEMPKTNLGDIDNYMDIPIEAASGGIMHGLGGYSDGGRLLKGPGDGVSDSIPAVIGKRQPARLADGEFVIPARIVSELGNGSTEAGARKLYAMMERVQASRKKSIGKKKVAVNSKSDKHLPA
jgi:hypothetical protein